MIQDVFDLRYEDLSDGEADGRWEIIPQELLSLLEMPDDFGVIISGCYAGNMKWILSLFQRDEFQSQQ